MNERSEVGFVGKHVQKSIVVYALADPRNHMVRYVGRSKNLKRRLNGHGSGKAEHRLRAWRNDLRARNLRPIHIVLQRTNNPEDALEAETSWIHAFSGQGLLLNVLQVPESHGFVRYDLWLSRSVDKRLGAKAANLGLERKSILYRSVESAIGTAD